MKSIVNFLDRIWQNWKWLWSSEQLIDPVKQATWEKSVLSVPITVEHSTFPCYLWAWCTKFHTISIIMGWLLFWRCFHSGFLNILVRMAYEYSSHNNLSNSIRDHSYITSSHFWDFWTPFPPYTVGEDPSVRKVFMLSFWSLNTLWYV